MADLPFDPKSPRSKTDGSEPSVVTDISLDDEGNDPFPLNFVRGLGDDIVDLTDLDDAATPGLPAARPERTLANEQPAPEPEKPRLGPAPLRPELERTEWRSAGRMSEPDATVNARAEAAAMPEARAAVGGLPLRISPRPDTEQEPVVSSATSGLEPLCADPAAAPATSIAPEPRGGWRAFLLSMLVVSALTAGAWWWPYARVPEVASVVDEPSRAAAGRTRAVPPDAASPAEPAEVPVVVAGLPAAEEAPPVNTVIVPAERLKPASGQGLVEPLKASPVQTEPREPTPVVPLQPLRVEAAPQMQTEPPAPLRVPEPTEPMQAETSLQPSRAQVAPQVQAEPSASVHATKPRTEPTESMATGPSKPMQAERSLPTQMEPAQPVQAEQTQPVQASSEQRVPPLSARVPAALGERSSLQEAPASDSPDGALGSGAVAPARPLAERGKPTGTTAGAASSIEVPERIRRDPDSAAAAMPPPAPVELQRDATTYRSAGARADQMATYQSGREAPIVLLADPCPTDKTGQSKVAYQKKSKSDMLAGCWSFDLQNHPVVTWLDGRVQALDAAQVRFEPKYVHTTEEKPTDAALQARAPSQVVITPRADVLPQVAVAPPAEALPRVAVAPRTYAPPVADAPSATASPARPAWCKDAKREHELLICRDRELSANDLALIPYWRSYRSRMGLDRAEETRVKNDFYRRLKACRSTRECIGYEQAAQMAFYRKALGYE